MMQVFGGGLLLLFIACILLKKDFREITIVTSKGDISLLVKVAKSQQEFSRGLMFINYLLLIIYYNLR